MKAEIIVFGIVASAIIILSIAVNVPTEIKSSLPNLGKAPELTGTQGWINSKPLEISDQNDKVVLVDFWTYSCINCIRTLPYLNSWHEKYADKGLVIIGVHTPEFEFEKNYENVKAAVEKYGIKYAVVQDNEYATWRAYKNQYWPRKYLVDAEGNIRYDHIGEGDYEETEKAIQELLSEIDAKLDNTTTKEISDTDFSQIGSPELYFGYRFARAPLGNTEGFMPGETVDYKSPQVTTPNLIYLEGLWKNEADYMESVSDGKIYLIYHAKDVNIVAGGNAEITVKVDSAFAKGEDVINGTATVDEETLYNIVSDEYKTAFLEIETTPGLKIYTFTFG